MDKDLLMSELKKDYRGFTERKPKKLLFLVLVILFFLAIGYGSVLSNEGGDILKRITEGFLEKKQETSFFESFLYSFSSSAIFILLLFLNGFSAVGQPFSIFLVIFRGMGFGMSIGHLYLSLTLKEILISVLVLVLPGIISGYVLLLAARESIRLSNKFLKAMTSEEFKVNFKEYFFKFIILTLFIVFSSVVSGILSVVAGYFY